MGCDGAEKMLTSPAAPLAPKLLLPMSIIGKPLLAHRYDAPDTLVPMSSSPPIRAVRCESVVTVNGTSIVPTSESINGAVSTVNADKTLSWTPALARDKSRPRKGPHLPEPRFVVEPQAITSNALPVPVGNCVPIDSSGQVAPPSSQYCPVRLATSDGYSPNTCSRCHFNVTVGIYNFGIVRIGVAGLPRCAKGRKKCRLPAAYSLNKKVGPSYALPNAYFFGPASKSLSLDGTLSKVGSL